jgi:hypothetical protein
VAAPAGWIRGRCRQRFGSSLRRGLVRAGTATVGRIAVEPEQGIGHMHRS